MAPSPLSGYKWSPWISLGTTEKHFYIWTLTSCKTFPDRESLTPRRQWLESRTTGFIRAYDNGHLLPFSGIPTCQSRRGNPTKLHWKKLEVNLAQNGLPQFQGLYRLPLLPLLSRCRVTAYVYSKFQYGMHKSTQIATPQRVVNSAWIVFRVYPIIHEYSESYTPF